MRGGKKSKKKDKSLEVKPDPNIKGENGLTEEAAATPRIYTLQKGSNGHKMA